MENDDNRAPDCVPCAATGRPISVGRRGLLKAATVTAALAAISRFTPLSLLSKRALAATVCGAWVHQQYREVCLCGPCNPTYPSRRVCLSYRRRFCYPQGCEECGWYEFAYFSVSGCGCWNGRNCVTACGGYTSGCLCGSV